MNMSESHRRFLTTEITKKMVDKSYSDVEVLAAIRYVKYDILNGSNPHFKNFLIPILKHDGAKDRLCSIWKTIMSKEGYKKPRKQFDRWK